MDGCVCVKVGLGGKVAMCLDAWSDFDVAAKVE
jgi:hypothetical protein